ncbi:MAG TPA: sensor histidine kinase [Gemmatimonadales bacterium]|nr:sensor histidine kinase [Gemmatimonadales bacterium]
MPVTVVCAKRVDTDRDQLAASLERQMQRIAQALHDEAGQLLTCAHMALDDVAESVPPSAQPGINTVRRHLFRIEDELRHIAYELRPRIVEEIGLVPALEFLSKGIGKRWHLVVDVDAVLERRLPTNVETAVYRIVQEALSNASRHGHANRIVIVLRETRRMLRCTVDDDGVGFDSSSLGPRSDGSGVGLGGIVEQVERLGGSMRIESAPLCGTRLTYSIPLAE